MNKENVINITGAAELKSAIENAGEDILLILDFWAPWCEPCKALSPALEAAVARHSPQIQLIKINVEESQSLAAQFQIQNIPAVKFILNGKLTAEFVGAQSEQVIEQHIKKSLPASTEEPDELNIALEFMKNGNYDKAITLLTKITQESPDSSEAHFNLAKCYIAGKDILSAKEELNKITSVNMAKQRELLNEIISLFEKCEEAGGKDAAAKKAMENPSDLDAVFDWACCLAVDDDYPAAFEALLSIIAKDRKFKDDEPRKILINLFAYLGAKNPFVIEYRERLAKILYI